MWSYGGTILLSPDPIIFSAALICATLFGSFVSQAISYTNAPVWGASVSIEGLWTATLYLVR